MDQVKKNIKNLKEDIKYINKDIKEEFQRDVQLLEEKYHKQKVAIILMFVCTIFTSMGQILWKYGLIDFSISNPTMLINAPFLLGFVSYGIGALLLMLALKGGELSILYPIIATGYVIVGILSPIIFPTDSMNFLKWSGVIVILLSVGLLGISGSNKKQHFQHFKKHHSEHKNKNGELL